MNDQVFEDSLSRRLKRATLQIAEMSPLNLDVAQSIARPRRDTRTRALLRRVLHSRIGIAAALVVGVAFASGTAYAGITLLQAVTQTDPGAAAVYRQDLGETLNLSQTHAGVTLTLTRAYADINRVMITYAVRPAGTKSIYAGFAAPGGEPVVTDSRGQVLAGYDAYFQTDPRSNESVGVVVYDAELVGPSVRDLSLTVTVPGLNIQTRGSSTAVGPFSFHLSVPVISGQAIVLGRTITIDSVRVTLDKVVASPSETRVYLDSSSSLKGIGSKLPIHVTTIRITGKGYDTRTAVITGPTELVDLGSTFQAPDGEQVFTFNNTLFGKHGSFTLTIDGISVGDGVGGPWIVHFVVP
jgi:hypothetical protein